VEKPIPFKSNTTDCTLRYDVSCRWNVDAQEYGTSYTGAHGHYLSISMA
jgi:hypothetical protein